MKKIIKIFPIIIILILSFMFFYSMGLKNNPNLQTQTKIYAGNTIKKVEIEDKYVCFVLREFRAMSCLIKE